ncbi:hypothetical protein IAG44_07345 [Streptomyces roseirectus]|uniref:Integral-membrane protein n=1 Tax=Streptomyces roseirectus TaxID=2768066 RepID=A0A7H0I906_9ACTN|nr:hypothetical protein [Streptomyces roseirectus]QNP69272.1 hypothetical protein IAG44_07345 [Streptomyces roseirectus]
MTAGWCARTGRAAMFAAVCVLLAALGHVTMSGAGLPAWALAAAFGATGAVAWTLAGRERGLPAVVAGVLAVQTLLHQGFSAVQHAGTPDTAGMASMDMSQMPSMAHMGMPHAHDGMTSSGADASTSSPGMLLAHLLAALLCGLWLAYGERAAFRIARAVGARLAAPLRLALAVAVPPEFPRPRWRGRHSARAPKSRLLVHSLTSRGPPPGCAAA